MSTIDTAIRNAEEALKSVRVILDFLSGITNAPQSIVDLHSALIALARSLIKLIEFFQDPSAGNQIRATDSPLSKDLDVTLECCQKELDFVVGQIQNLESQATSSPQTIYPSVVRLAIRSTARLKAFTESLLDVVKAAERPPPFELLKNDEHDIEASQPSVSAVGRNYSHISASGNTQVHFGNIHYLSNPYEANLVRDDQLQAVLDQLSGLKTFMEQSNSIRDQSNLQMMTEITKNLAHLNNHNPSQTTSTTEITSIMQELKSLRTDIESLRKLDRPRPAPESFSNSYSQIKVQNSTVQLGNTYYSMLKVSSQRLHKVLRSILYNEDLNTLWTSRRTLSYTTQTGTTSESSQDCFKTIAVENELEINCEFEDDYGILTCANSDSHTEEWNVVEATECFSPA